MGVETEITEVEARGVGTAVARTESRDRVVEIKRVECIVSGVLAVSA